MSDFDVIERTVGSYTVTLSEIYAEEFDSKEWRIKKIRGKPYVILKDEDVALAAFLLRGSPAYHVNGDTLDARAENLTRKRSRTVSAAQMRGVPIKRPPASDSNREWYRSATVDLVLSLSKGRQLGCDLKEAARLGHIHILDGRTGDRVPRERREMEFGINYWEISLTQRGADEAGVPVARWGSRGLIRLDLGREEYLRAFGRIKSDVAVDEFGGRRTTETVVLDPSLEALLERTNG